MRVQRFAFCSLVLSVAYTVGIPQLYGSDVPCCQSAKNEVKEQASSEAKGQPVILQVCPVFPWGVHVDTEGNIYYSYYALTAGDCIPVSVDGDLLALATCDPPVGCISARFSGIKSLRSTKHGTTMKRHPIRRKHFLDKLVVFEQHARVKVLRSGKVRIARFQLGTTGIDRYARIFDVRITPKNDPSKVLRAFVGWEVKEQNFNHPKLELINAVRADTPTGDPHIAHIDVDGETYQVNID